MIVRKLTTNAAFAAWLTAGLALVLVLPGVVAYLSAAVAGFAPSANPNGFRIFSWALLGRSVFIASTVAVVSGLLGAVCGTVAGRLRRGALVAVVCALVLPLAMPPSVHAYVWRNIALSAGLLGGLFVEGGSRIVNFAGVVLSLVCAFWTIPALAALSISAGPARRYELEARPFAAPSVAARRILIPSIVPAVAASSGLVFILALSEYGAAALWQTNTFPAHVLSLYSSTFQPRLAAAASLVPALVTGLIAAAVFMAASKALSSTAVERANVDAAMLWRPSAALKLVLAFFVLVLVGVPIAVSAGYTWAGWTGLAHLGGILRDLRFSILFASAAAVVGGVAAIGVACVHWNSSRLARNLVCAVALAAFFLPSAGAGLAVKTVSQMSIIPRALDGTPAALIYAYAGRFLAIPLMLAVVALSRVDRDYRHLVEISGAGGLRSALSAAGPIAFPAVLAGFAIAVVLAVAEIPIAMLVSPPGRPPVSVDLFNLMHYARQSEAFAVAAAMSIGSCAAIMVAFAIAGRLWKRYLPTH